MPFEYYKLDEAAKDDFKKIGDDFANEFQPHDEYIFIANKIVHLLIDKPDTAFNRYADPNISIDEVCSRLYKDVQDAITNSEPFVKSIVRAFTSHGGLYREQLEELLKAYFKFVEKCANSNK